MTTLCPNTEARMLAACIVQPDVLEAMADLEAEDFALPQHRAAFMAIRHLQATGESVTVLAVADAIEMRDLERGLHVADTVNVGWLGCLICDTTNYTQRILLERDATWLRTLANRRRAA